MSEVPGEGGARPAWSYMRAALDARGFQPSKALGQNFLRDGNMTRAIVRDAGVEPGDFVLEVGPGCGFLTWHLLERGARVLAVEIDARLADVCRELFADRPGFTLLQGDVLDGKHALNACLLERLPRDTNWRVVANLPYSAGTPFLVLASRLAAAPRSMTVLLQRELASRIAASPGSRAFGPVAAKIQCRYAARSLRPLAPELFWPRPKVHSTLLELVRRDDVPLPEAELARFDGLVDALFHARRKRALGAYSAWCGGRERALLRFGAVGAREDARAEDLSVEQIAALARLGDPAS